MTEPRRATVCEAGRLEGAHGRPPHGNGQHDEVTLGLALGFDRVSGWLRS